MGIEVLKCSFSHCMAAVVNRNLFKCHLNVLIWQNTKLAKLGQMPKCTDL